MVSRIGLEKEKREPPFWIAAKDPQNGDVSGSLNVEGGRRSLSYLPPKNKRIFVIGPVLICMSNVYAIYYLKLLLSIPSRGCFYYPP